jgi:outer membrane protein TolC
MDIVYNVESAYWNLVYSIENLKVRQQSVDLAKDLLETNKRSVEVGTLAPMDILSAQAEVATREADLIQAEAQVQSSQDALAVLINMPEKEQEALGAIVPLDSPSYTEQKTNLEEALAAALQYRPDLETSKLGISADELSLKYTKNQLLPDLNLSASYAGSGVSGTQILYEGSPLQGIVIGTVPGNMSGAIRDALRFLYPNWSVGVTLNVPFSNLFSRASFTQAKLNLRQSMLQLENQQQQVFLEIKNGVRNIDANFKRIAAYKVARELAEQKLTAEQEKLRVGQSTNYNVLLFQRDLANARISELNSIIAYNVSLAALERSMGVTLRDKNIKFTDYVQN